MRGAFGVLLMGSGAIVVMRGHLAALVLVAGGVFCLYEAGRGWCLMRACGIKTRL